MYRGIQWNDDLDAALRKVYEEVPHQDDRAAIMGFSVPTLRRRARHLGLVLKHPAPPPQPRAESRQAIALYKQGHTRREIAELTGLTRNAVTGVLWRAKRRGDLPRG